MLHKTFISFIFSFSGDAWDDFRDGSYCQVEMRQRIISDTWQVILDYIFKAQNTSKMQPSRTEL